MFFFYFGHTVVLSGVFGRETYLLSSETYLHRPREVCYITYTNNVCLCQAAAGGKINSIHAESLMFVTHWPRHKHNAI